jgi:hypothetical protein
VIDMHAEEITRRIDLADLRTMVSGTNADGEEVEELAYARPGAIVRLGDYAVVGLARLSASWIAAPGMVAVIDVEHRELVGGFELDGLKNCTGVSQVVGRDDAVLVGCSGYPFGDTASAGLALLSIDEDGELHEEEALREQDAPVLYAGMVSLGGTRLLAVATGDYAANTGDKAYILDIASGERERLFGTDTPGSIGSGAYRSETGLLLVPDAELGVRLFDVADDEVTASGEVELDAALPARTVRAIRP